MKKLILMALAVATITACEKPIIADDSYVEEEVLGENVPTKKFTFTMKGDFASPTMRGYLQADGKDMTDLWVFDFMDGVCVQSVHQQPATAGDDWGKPVMNLAYGSHHVYFVASRGSEPVVDNNAHTIQWTTPRDTFWKDYSVDVVSTSNGNRAVTLDRVATKLKLTVTDEVPTGTSVVTITPSTWYYGINYTTGAAVAPNNAAFSINIPSSMIGTSGDLILNIFGLSGADEWTTDVNVTAYDGNSIALGSANISGAPFLRNRSTEYSGNLFASGSRMNLQLNDSWTTAHVDTW